MLPGKFAGQHFLLSVAEVSGLRSKQCVYIIISISLGAAEAIDLRYGYNIAGRYCY